MNDVSNNHPIYVGQFRHALDGKKRLVMPARWRNPDEAEFYIVPNPSNEFLCVLPPREVEAIHEATENSSQLSAREKRTFIRQFHSKLQLITVDKQGRFSLAEEHCKLTNLTTEVILVGGHTRFELWNPNLWEQTEKEESATYQQVANLVGL